MGSHQFGFDMQIEGDGTEELDFTVAGKKDFINVSQVAAQVINPSGDNIVPNTGILRIWIKPFGSDIFLEGDQDLDLTQGEFYRPFSAKIVSIKAQVIGIDPSDSTTLISITKV